MFINNFYEQCLSNLLSFAVCDLVRVNVENSDLISIIKCIFNKNFDTEFLNELFTGLISRNVKNSHHKNDKEGI